MEHNTVNTKRLFQAGYACLNLDTDSTFRTCRLSNLTLERWQELILVNLSALKEIIEYNRKYHLPMYRISSDLIPFGSTDVIDFDWASHFKTEFHEISELIGDRMRVSMHPGQYTVLNSPDRNIVDKAIKDLEYHIKVLKLLGATSNNKLVLHIGGVYGDKEAAISRFISEVQQLPSEILDHLVIENDERLFNIEEVIGIGHSAGVPVVFDNLHHEINQPPGNKESADYWITQAAATWKEKDGRQIIHYSEQAPDKRPGAHSDTVGTEEFFRFLRKIQTPLDIMLEVKDKNRSAEKIQMVLTHDVKLAEKIWAKSKYAVLARSQALYLNIRQILRDKEDADLMRFAMILDESAALPLVPGEAANAAEHVWGYFKEKVTVKEREHFKKLLEDLHSGEAGESQIKAYLLRMLHKYPNDYLSESYYFR